MLFSRVLFLISFSLIVLFHRFRWWIQNCLNCPSPVRMVTIVIHGMATVAETVAETISTEVIMIVVHLETMAMAIVWMVLATEKMHSDAIKIAVKMAADHVFQTMTVHHVIHRIIWMVAPVVVLVEYHVSQILTRLSVHHHRMVQIQIHDLEIAMAATVQTMAAVQPVVAVRVVQDFRHPIHKQHRAFPTMIHTINHRQTMISIKIQQPNLNHTTPTNQTHTIITNQNFPRPIPQMAQPADH